MTTEQPLPSSGRGTAPRWGALWLGPLSASALLGLVLVLAAAGLTGAPGAFGAGVGAALVCLVFSLGAIVLGVVSHVAPAASLLVALLTYTLQVLLVGVVYVGLSSGGALDGPVDARWLSAGVIVCTLVWTTTQVLVSVRSRQLIYDLPGQGSDASVR